MSTDRTCICKPDRVRSGRSGQPRYDIKKEVLLAMKDEGLKRWEMAERLGVDDSTVKRNLKLYGISLREQSCDRKLEEDTEKSARARQTRVVQEDSGQVENGEVCPGGSGSACVSLYQSVPNTLRTTGEAHRKAYGSSTLSEHGRALDQPHEPGFEEIEHCKQPSKPYNNVAEEKDGDAPSCMLIQTTIGLRKGALRLIQGNTPENGYESQEHSLSATKTLAGPKTDTYLDTAQDQTSNAPCQKKARFIRKGQAAGKAKKFRKSTRAIQSRSSAKNKASYPESPVTTASERSPSPHDLFRPQNYVNDIYLDSDESHFKYMYKEVPPDIHREQVEEDDAIECLSVEMKWSELGVKINGGHHQKDQLSRWCQCPLPILQYPF